MELAQICQVSYRNLRSEKIDFLIAASGYQMRSTYLAGMNLAPNARKYMLSLSEEDHHELRHRHEAAFLEMGFQIFKATPDKPEEVDDLIRTLCKSSSGKEITMLVDYSCMPRVWFASILDSITRHDFHTKKINVFFSYTPKKFSLKTSKSTLKYLGPMIGSKDHLKKSKPIALVMPSRKNAPAAALSRCR